MVVISEEEFSKLIHRIETMIQAPENKAAQQFARIAVETLKSYMPSVIDTHLTKTTDLISKSRCRFNPEILRDIGIDLKKALLEYLTENRSLLLKKLAMNAISLESSDIIITLFSEDDFLKLESALGDMIG